MTSGNSSDCDKEPIHIPGAIQPHGLMIVLDHDSMSIVQTSENVSEELLLSEFEGVSLDQLFEARSVNEILHNRIDHRTRFVRVRARSGLANQYNALLHRSPDGQLVLEMERVQREEGAISSEHWLRLGDVMRAVHASGNLDALLSEACRAVHELTGYDRVMIYRFHEDLHGEVVAEETLHEQESWLGLHYPASDIPSQARDLYLKNWLRMIPDVDYEPMRLVPPVSPKTGKPLDMTYCHLRSVSPVHIQYLKNMGTKASLSLSLISPEGLWGLIACHNSVPRYIDPLAREMCRGIARHLSAAIVNREIAKRTLTAEKLLEFCADFRNGALNIELLKELIPCQKVVSTGELALPAAIEIDKTLAGVLHCREAPVFAATDLKEHTLPGLMALRLRQDCWLALMRQEHISEVRWAGNPNKAVLGEPNRLQPRASFEEWKDSVRGRSKDWTQLEREIASLMQLVISGQRTVEWLQDHLSQRRSAMEQFASDLRGNASECAPTSHLDSQQYSI